MPPTLQPLACRDVPYSGLDALKSSLTIQSTNFVIDGLRAGIRPDYFRAALAARLGPSCYSEFRLGTFRISASNAVKCDFASFPSQAGAQTIPARR
ncbi:MAG: hypothetical protein E5X10_13430 [Mesorhizobium sp.]|nr:MAG: hypothetical protein E5X10_13430 [Mesorhizobium sp.]